RTCLGPPGYALSEHFCPYARPEHKFVKRIFSGSKWPPVRGGRRSLNARFHRLVPRSAEGTCWSGATPDRVLGFSFGCPKEAGCGHWLFGGPPPVSWLAAMPRRHGRIRRTAPIPRSRPGSEA